MAAINVSDSQCRLGGKFLRESSSEILVKNPTKTKKYRNLIFLLRKK